MNRKLRIGFLGARILGYRCLQELAAYSDKIDVAFVVARKKDGEDGSDWNPPLLPLARAMGFPTWEPVTLSDDIARAKFEESNLDLVINPFGNRIIPENLIRVPRLGTVNIHYGKLPQYRGRFIVSHIILNGETDTCATAHYIEGEIDTGDIIFEERVPVLETDTAKDLYLRCTDAGVVLFRRILDHALAGIPLPRLPQTGTGQYFPFEEPNGCQLDPSWPRDRQLRFIRALTFPPISAPWIDIGGNKFKITPDESD